MVKNLQVRITINTNAGHILVIIYSKYLYKKENKILFLKLTNGTKYSRIDQVKYVEDSLFTWCILQ